MNRYSSISLPLVFTFLMAATSCSSPGTKSQPSAAPSATPSSIPSPAPSPKPTTSPDTLTCTKKNDQRKAEIHKKGSGCEVEYQKLGKSSIAARSSSGEKHCEDALAKIRKNLTAAGFSCQ